MPFIIKLFLGPLFFFLFISTGYAKSNDPFGDIYITKDFGDLSNCGPIAALMLSKYTNKKLPTENLSSNIRYARTTAQKDKDSYRWWRMSDIKKYFSREDIEYTSLAVKDSEVIKDQLDKNGAVVINVNMNNLSRGSRIGKPYFTFPLPGGWGHFLVIVGYKEVENKLLFEIHDSFVKKGNNRSYYADEILSAVKRYNPEMLVVYNGNNGSYDSNLEYAFEIGIIGDLENQIKAVELGNDKSAFALADNSLDSLLDSDKITKVALTDILESGKYNDVIANINLDLVSLDKRMPQNHVHKKDMTIASIEELLKLGFF